MSMTVEERPVRGVSVYGVVPNEYVVAGREKPLDYGAVVGIVSLQRAVALEAESAALTNAVRMRFRRVDELSEVLRQISVALANEKKMTDDVDFPEADSARSILQRNGVQVDVELSAKMNKGELFKLQANVQFALDKESNQVQQDVTSVRYITGNRDNSIRSATSLQKKVYDGVDNTINKMGV